MSKNIEKIKKLFRETLIDGIFLKENCSARDVVDICEEQGKLFSHKGLFIGAGRTSYKKSDCIRIVFVIKESNSGKVKDIDRVFELIKEIEQAIIYIDHCEQMKSDGFIYIDIVKKLLPEN